MYKVHIAGKDLLDYINLEYVLKELNQYDFETIENVEDADFIYMDSVFEDNSIYDMYMNLSNIFCIEIAECIDDLLRLRDDYEFRESQVR